MLLVIYDQLRFAGSPIYLRNFEYGSGNQGRPYKISDDILELGSPKYYFST
jgi:hypothetical protein